MFQPAEFKPNLHFVVARPVTVRRTGNRLLFRVCAGLAEETGIQVGLFAHVLVEKNESGKLTGLFRLTGSQRPSARRWTKNQQASPHPIFSCQISGDLATILAALPPASQNLTIHEKHPKNGITVSYAPPQS